MVRVVFILLLLGVSAWGETTNGTISLESAINTALTGNRDLAALELELNGRVLAAEQARYQFAFNLRPIAAVSTRTESDFVSYGLAGSKQLPVGTEVEVGVRMDEINTDDSGRERTGAVFVEVTQPVFRDWGTLVNRENIVQADNNIMAARRVLELRKSDLIVQVVEVSQSLLRLQRLLDYEERVIERYERLARLTRAREKQGRATQVERLRVEFLKGQAEARKANALEQLRSQQADYANLLGLAPETRLLPEETPDLRLAIPERDFAVTAALSNRLDFAQAIQDIVDAKRGIAIAENRVKPSFSVVGRYEKLGRDTSWNDAWALDEDGWIVGLSTDSDLLLRDERMGLRQAALDEQTARLRLEDVDALIRRQVEQAMSDNRRAEAELQIAESNLTLATQRAALSQRLYEKGKIDNNSATDAETELLEAQTKVLDNRAEAVIAGYRLLRMMGLLLDVPDELKPAAASGTQGLMKLRWIYICSALTLGGLLILSSAFLRRPDADLQLHEVTRGPLRVWTTYDGTIQSRTIRGVSSQLGGGATVTDLIPEGTTVTSGTPLVRLDATSLERDLLRLERDRTLARAEYDSLTKAKLPLEKRELEMRMIQARSELQEAEDSLADLNELIADQLIPANDAVQQEKKNVLLRNAVENLEQQLSLTQDFLHPAAIERATAQRDSAEREWELSRRQLDDSTINAPGDGVVVYQPVAVGSEFRTIRVGDTVYKNQVFISLPDMSNLIVQVDVPEHELTLAQTGRLVSVQPLAYPGMNLAGVVESVGSMAQTRPDRPGRQKFFTVVVRLTEARDELKSGMSARVRVLSHDEPDALLVPRAAIFWENNEAYCRVIRDSVPQRVRVVTGPAGATEVAVLSGLEPGQRVVLP